MFCGKHDHVFEGNTGMFSAGRIRGRFFTGHPMDTGHPAADFFFPVRPFLPRPRAQIQENHSY